MPAMSQQQKNILSRTADLSARYRDLLAEARMVSEQVSAVGGPAAFAAADYPLTGDLQHVTDAGVVLMAFAAFNALDAVSIAPLVTPAGNAPSALQPILRMIR